MKKILVLFTLALFVQGCSWTPNRKTEVSFLVQSPASVVTSATAVVSEQSMLLGEWQTTATLEMTPNGPKGTARDAKTKNTLQSLGAAVIGAAASYFTMH